MILQNIIQELGNLCLSVPEPLLQTVEISGFAVVWEHTKLQANTAYIGMLSGIPQDFPREAPLFCIRDCDADTGSFPLMTLLPQTIDLLSLAENISSILAGEHHITGRMHSLIATLSSKKGLQHLTNEAANILHNPVIIIDAGFKLLAMCDTPIPGYPDMEQQRNLGCLLDSDIEILKKNNVFEHTRQAGLPYLSKDPSTGSNWITALVYVHGVEFAQISVMEHNRKFTDSDIGLVQLLSELVSLELQKEEFYQNNQGLMHNFLLYELLSGELYDLNVMAMRLAHLDWRLTRWLRVFSVTDGNASFFGAKVQLIARQLGRLLPDSRWIVYQGRIVFVLSLPGPSLTLITEENRLLEFLSVNNLTASVSDCFSELTSLQKYYQQSLTAWDIGHQTDPGRRIYAYEAYQLEHIGRIIAEQYELADFCHPVIAQIVEYDQRHKTELIPTLEAYLKFVDSPNAAAEALFIHRNTLFYRIHRIRELFQVDLGNGDVRLRLQLTLHFLKLKHLLQ